jgi:hypothetical protein
MLPPAVRVWFARMVCAYGLRVWFARRIVPMGANSFWKLQHCVGGSSIEVTINAKYRDRRPPHTTFKQKFLIVIS